jgi:hypothetical protein
MTSLAPECIQGEPENHKMWSNGDSGPIAAAPCGNVTRGSKFALSRRTAIIPRQRLLSFFQAFTNFSGDRAASAPVPG